MTMFSVNILFRDEHYSYPFIYLGITYTIHTIMDIMNAWVVKRYILVRETWSDLFNKTNAKWKCNSLHNAYNIVSSVSTKFRFEESNRNKSKLGGRNMGVADSICLQRYKFPDTITCIFSVSVSINLNNIIRHKSISGRASIKVI